MKLELNTTGRVLWLDMILRLGWQSLIKRGQAYVNQYKLTDFNLSLDGVEAKVPNKFTRSCIVKIVLKHYLREEWSEILNTLAREALYEGALLNFEMPSQLERSLHSKQIYLYPKESRDWTLNCTCLSEMPCEHIAAVLYILGEKCKLNPLLIFELRGMSPNLFMKNIRQTRFKNHQTELIKISSVTKSSDVKQSGNSQHEGMRELTYTVPKKNAWLISTVQDPDFWKRDVSLDRLLSSVYQEVSQRAAKIVKSDTPFIDGDKE